MIIKPRYLRWMALLALGLLLCIGCTAADTPTSHDGPATLELKRLVAATSLRIPFPGRCSITCSSGTVQSPHVCPVKPVA